MFAFVKSIFGWELLKKLLKSVIFLVTLFLLWRLFKKNKLFFLIGLIGAFLIALAKWKLNAPSEVFWTALPLWAVIVTYLPDVWKR